MSEHGDASYRLAQAKGQPAEASPERAGEAASEASTPATNDPPVALVAPNYHPVRAAWVITRCAWPGRSWLAATTRGSISTSGALG